MAPLLLRRLVEGRVETGSRKKVFKYQKNCQVQKKIVKYKKNVAACSHLVLVLASAKKDLVLVNIFLFFTSYFVAERFKNI